MRFPGLGYRRREGYFKTCDHHLFPMYPFIRTRMILGFSVDKIRRLGIIVY